MSAVPHSTKEFSFFVILACYSPLSLFSNVSWSCLLFLIVVFQVVAVCCMPCHL
eukprot:m.89521 g.89521  ORF g.89521 m.89521 type:complete len:54 (-) comp8534_c2_seq1:544-705(-)